RRRGAGARDVGQGRRGRPRGRGRRDRTDPSRPRPRRRRRDHHLRAPSPRSRRRVLSSDRPRASRRRRPGRSRSMIARSLLAAIVKDLRLLARDRVGLVFLTIAPLIVMSVAGFSLSTLFGSAPEENAAYLLPLVDEDGGRIGDELRERLSGDRTIEVRVVPSREQALELVRSRAAGAVLVIPDGTSAALRRGASASLLLFTDPVKFVEVANVRFAVQELRQQVGQQSIDRAQRRIDRVRARALAGQRK